jgi:hypothetical protein
MSDTPRCHRLIQGHSTECPAAYGSMHLERWCPVCLAAYDAWCDEQAEQARLDALASQLPVGIPAEEPEPFQPSPLEDWQVEAWTLWLGEPPAWSYRQVSDRSPN